MISHANVRPGSLYAALKWQLTSMRLLLPVLIVVQMLVAGAFSVGISMFHGALAPTAALYLGTGAATVVLVFVGLVVGPQMVAGEKEAGTYDFSRSLPIRDSVRAVSWIVVCAIVSIPSTVVALAIASWRLDIEYEITWRIGPSMVLVLVCGTLLGYVIAHAIENPMTIQLSSQVLAFAVLGFTPITYPLANLPDWFANLQLGLPFYHMGAIVRDGLTTGAVDDVLVSYAVVGAWLALAIAAARVVLGKTK